MFHQIVSFPTTAFRLSVSWTPLRRYPNGEQWAKYRTLARFLDLAKLPPGSMVADVGCGHGRNIVWLAQSRPDVSFVGLDVDQERLESARLAATGVPNVTFVSGHAQALPWSDGSIDAVISTQVFEHFNSEGRRDVLREMSRVLREDGQLVLSTPGPKFYSHGFRLLRLLSRLPRVKDRDEVKHFRELNAYSPKIHGHFRLGFYPAEVFADLPDELVPIQLRHLFKTFGSIWFQASVAHPGLRGLLTPLSFPLFALDRFFPGDGLDVYYRIVKTTGAASGHAHH